LSSPHYGCSFQIDLVDATTDKTIGTGLLTAQALLQQQRDFLIEDERVSLLKYFREAINFSDMRRITVDLRHDMKNATDLQHFSPPKSFHDTSKTQKGKFFLSYRWNQLSLEHWGCRTH